MNASTFRFAVLALVLAAAGCVSHPDPAPARLPPGATQPSLAEQAAIQAAASRPGKKHRALDTFVGAWLTSNVAVDAEGRETDPVSGRAAVEWVLGGRYLSIDANLSLPDGATHTWSGFLGYDESLEEYQWLMVSDLSTGMGVAHGRGELTHGGIRFALDVVVPRTGGLARATSVLRATDADHIVLEQIGLDATGVERVLRRTHYQRATTKG